MNTSIKIQPIQENERVYLKLSLTVDEKEVIELNLSIADAKRIRDRLDLCIDDRNEARGI